MERFLEDRSGIFSEIEYCNQLRMEYIWKYYDVYTERIQDEYEQLRNELFEDKRYEVVKLRKLDEKNGFIIKECMK